jgi:hypothetical protein
MKLNEKNSLLKERLLHLEGLLKRWQSTDSMEESLKEKSISISEIGQRYQNQLKDMAYHDQIQRNLELKIGSLNQNLEESNSSVERLTEKNVMLHRLVEDMRKSEIELKHRYSEQLSRIRHEMENNHLVELKSARESYEREKLAMISEMQKVSESLMQESQLPQLTEEVAQRRSVAQALMSSPASSSDPSTSSRQSKRRAASKSHPTMQTKRSVAPKAGSNTSHAVMSSSDDDSGSTRRDHSRIRDSHDDNRLLSDGEADASFSTEANESKEDALDNESHSDIRHHYQTNDLENDSNDATNYSGVSNSKNIEVQTEANSIDTLNHDGADESHIDHLQHLLDIQINRTQAATEQIVELEQLLEAQRHAFMRHLSVERNVNVATGAFSNGSVSSPGDSSKGGAGDSNRVGTASSYDQTNRQSSPSEDFRGGSRSDGSSDISLPLPPSYAAVAREVIILVL